MNTMFTGKAFEKMQAEATTAMKAFNKVYPFEQVMNNVSEETQDKMLAAGKKMASKALREMQAEMTMYLDSQADSQAHVSTKLVLKEQGKCWQKALIKMEAAAEQAQSNAMRLGSEASYKKCAKAIYAVKVLAYNMVSAEAELRKLGLWEEIAA